MKIAAAFAFATIVTLSGNVQTYADGRAAGILNGVANIVSAATGQTRGYPRTGYPRTSYRPINTSPSIYYPPSRPSFPSYPQPVNPVVQDRTSVTGIKFDQYGNPIFDTDRKITHASALDPNRNVVDPGSLRNVDRTEYDAYGQLVQVTGYTWTSYGQPHSQLKRRPLSGGPSGSTTTVSRSSSVAMSPSPGTQTTISSYGRPQRSTTTTSYSNSFGGYNTPRGSNSTTSVKSQTISSDRSSAPFGGRQ